MSTLLPHEDADHLISLGVHVFRTDVTKESSVRQLKDDIYDLTRGRLDILINNAGICYTMPATDTEISQVERMFAVNVFGPMRMVSFFHPMLIRAQGVVVNIGSIGGVCPFVYGASYNASKAALHHYGNTLRVEMRPFGVRVVNIISGEVSTKILKNDHGRELPKGSGIGRDCAIAFACEGALGVVFADINLAAAAAAAKESEAKATNLNFRSMSIGVDVTSAESVDNMVLKAQEMFGRIDYSVNSAGIGVQQPLPVTETSIDEFQRFLEVNVKGTLLCVRAVSRVMIQQEPQVVEGRNGPRNVGRGSIVNIASANSFVATPAMVQYVSSKHAVIGITKTAALDLAKYGIRVNACCPSWVETPMVRQAFAAMPEQLESLVHMIPMGRIATQEEVSEAILFLSSPKSSYITGVGWIVDGGTTLTMKLS
ncbi:hypothetical protein KCU95_g1897, partial [Aureobasidium melanogenum]